MTPSRVFRIVCSAGGRVVAIFAMTVVLLGARAAYAESVDDLIQQLTNDSDKVRLSAALNLGTLGSQRAIRPLARAVVDDGDRSVRGAAAVGLGKLISDRTSAGDRAEAIAALTRAKADDSELVRSQAERALAAIGVAAPPSTGSIYVNIGPMSSRTGDAASDAKLQVMMTRVASRTLSRVARSMTTSWPGGPPSKAALDARKALGFYIDGTLNELKVKDSGSSTTVSCRINMLLASYPDKSIFGLLNGGATVRASGSASEIALAREDCVSAVVEDLIAKKIVPTINIKAAP